MSGLLGCGDAPSRGRVGKLSYRVEKCKFGFFCSFSAAVSLTSGSSEGSKNSHWNHSICTVTEVSDVLVERYCSYLQDF